MLNCSTEPVAVSSYTMRHQPFLEIFIAPVYLIGDATGYMGVDAGPWLFRKSLWSMCWANVRGGYLAVDPS